MTSAFRICKTKHVPTALSGEGARLNGGRWNSPGRAAVYTSSSLSLATLEVLVHLEEPEAFIRLFSWLSVEIPEDAVERVNPETLATGWRDDETNSSSRSVGDAWLRSFRSAVLAVPSVVTPGEWNYLLNPAHPRFVEIRVGAAKPFRLDPRLV